MITIDTIRAANAQGKRLEDLVVVFVGGTGGVGASTARELFLRTTRPKAYIIGRNEEKARGLLDDLHQSNPDGRAIFMPVDVSLFSNIDRACAELRRRESKLHGLILTTGYMTMQGRTETEEGLDRKMVVNYYGRMRWILRCMPLLTAASAAHELSRVITVLAAGSESDVYLDDLDLRHNFALHTCLAHCVLLSDFAMNELAKRYPGTSFSHSYPGTVKTGIANELTGAVRLAVKVLYAVMSPWILNVRESGERHFFQLTNACYPSSKNHQRDDVGLEIPDGVEVMKGMDGRIGSGAYLLDWDGETTGDEKVLNKYRDVGFGEIAWTHTLNMFKQAQRVSLKRAAETIVEEERPIPDPPLWRAGS